ncbi:MAG: radical SAM protein [Polyangiaceae bacterium]|jgi:MoaA/NifB/PqqE/SkfB family radical SAM enzyme|nr:radical SAM protein [Polyangiaceae bacterium]
MNLSTVFEISKAFALARLGRGHPLYLVHALTARCNARCGFCAWNPEFYDPKDQLSTPAIKRLYSDARAAGFVGVSIWGGEPLVYRDFDEVVRHAHEIGLATHMVTNGFLLEQRLDAVVRWVDRVCVSLDHPSAVHDELRGIRGLFERIVSATRALRARAPSKPIIFVCTLQKANVQPETLRSLCALMDDLGVLGIFNGLRHEAAAAGGDAPIDRYAPSDAELSAAFSTLRDLKLGGAPVLNSLTHLDMMRAGSPVYRCHWPKFMLPIEANGDVVDCMHWGTRPIGNVRDTPFQELLASPRLRALANEAGEACHKCVSIHRVELSEVSDGNLEPLRSWAMLRRSPGTRASPAH